MLSECNYKKKMNWIEKENVYCNTTGKSFFALFCFRQAVEETDASDSSDADDKERLGDKLFSLVEKLDPLRANDITGEVIH